MVEKIVVDREVKISKEDALLRQEYLDNKDNIARINLLDTGELYHFKTFEEMNNNAVSIDDDEIRAFLFRDGILFALKRVGLQS